jgi:hypothetical protein
MLYKFPGEQAAGQSLADDQKIHGHGYLIRLML